jgi:hypothetical protein
VSLSVLRANQKLTSQLPTIRQIALVSPESILVRGGTQREGRTQPGEEVTVTKRFLQGRESWFAGAVAGCDVLHIQRFVQRRHDLLDVRIARHYEVKAADDQMDARIDRAGRFDDLVNAGMWLERLPVTQEAAGSSPVAPANLSGQPPHARQ